MTQKKMAAKMTGDFFFVSGQESQCSVGTGRGKIVRKASFEVNGPANKDC
jgi:hypothetical protein